MKKRMTMCLVMLFSVLIMVQSPIFAKESETLDQTEPSITKAKLISDSDIELYWSEPVTGAGTDQQVDINHFSVTIDGKAVKIYQYTWEEYNASEYGITYYSPKNSEYPNNPDTPKTSIRLQEPVSDVNNLPEIKVTVKENTVRDSEGVYAKEQTVTIEDYDPFYQKKIVMDSGITILGSAKVKDEAMHQAEKMLEVITANQELAKRMGEAGCMLGIYGEGEIAYDILEHRYTYDEQYLYVEGFGGTPLASIKDANVLRLKAEDSPDYYTNYPDESILTHEFAHTIQYYGLTEKQQARWEQIYDNSVNKEGKWPGASAGEFSYAGSNCYEYFATLTAIWFNAMDDTWDGDWDGTRGPINTRKELEAYDKEAYDFLAEIYVSDQYLPSPWDNGTVPDHYTWITFDANGGSSISESRVIAQGEDVGTLPVVTKEGYLFDGWYTQAQGGTKVNEDTVVSSLDSCVIYAHWKVDIASETDSNNLNTHLSKNPVKTSVENPVEVKKATFSSVKALKGRKIAVKIKKVKDAEGYRITYCKNSKFKKQVKIKYTSSTKVTLKNLKKGTWYVKVEAYKKDIDGTKVFGKCSSTKKIKVK